jgi:pyridoxine kinase
MSGKGASRKPAVIVISSHVARGGVGNRAIVFALENLGFPVWAVPTVILPWHPGHGLATRIVPEAAAFAALLGDLARAPWLDEVGAVVSGYLGEAEQAGPIAALIEAVKARNPGALYLCDPVIGDAGGLYVPAPSAEAIRDRLLPLADIATPNLFELQWLSSRQAASREEVVVAARVLGPATVVATSAEGTAPERIGNLLISLEACLLAEHGRLQRPPNGAGDMFSALLMAGLLDGLPPEEALADATRTVFSMLRAAVAAGADELRLARDAALLCAPDAEIALHRLTPAGGMLSVA